MYLTKQIGTNTNMNDYSKAAYIIFTLFGVTILYVHKQIVTHCYMVTYKCLP